MSAKGITEYKNNAVTTQSPGQIVVLLYEGAIRFLREAIDALERKDYVTKGMKINKAIDIICELNAALNMEAGGEISSNLRNLYLFMHEQLLKANVKKDPQLIRQVIAQMQTLLEGWREVAA